MTEKYRKRRREVEEVSYWQSYSDLMAAALLVFVLILTFSMFESRRNLEMERDALQEQKKLTAEQQAKLEEQTNVLMRQQDTLRIQQDQLSEQQAQLDEQQEQLLLQQYTMDSQRETLESQQSIMKTQQNTLREQRKTLREQQSRLDRIIGVRAELIEALSKEFESSGLNVKVDSQTGAITFNSNILYDTDRSDIKSEGQAFLKDFFPIYFKVLLGSKFREYVAEVIIEGHTDTDGSYFHNLELSQQRAFSVAKYCLDEKNKILTEKQIEEIRNIMTANGRSYSNPVLNRDGSVNKDASRRVEIKFRLKDEEMVKEMENLLNDISKYRNN